MGLRRWDSFGSRKKMSRINSLSREQADVGYHSCRKCVWVGSSRCQTLIVICWHIHWGWAGKKVRKQSISLFKYPYVSIFGDILVSYCKLTHDFCSPEVRWAGVIRQAKDRSGSRAPQDWVTCWDSYGIQVAERWLGSQGTICSTQLISSHGCLTKQMPISKIAV